MQGFQFTIAIFIFISKKKKFIIKMYRRLATFLTILIMVLNVFSVAPIAQTTTTTNVDTVIIVNGGDVSNIDAAIAAGISAGTGIPVLYTEHGDIPIDVHNTLQDLNAENVVILGGPAVVSENTENSLEKLGYDVTRLHGTTATGTAVEAIEYFYGPGTLEEVTLVKYEGDNVQDYQDVLTLSAELGKPIIPIPSDVEGLPADVVNVLETIEVDEVTVVGDFAEETALKEDLSGINVDVATEIEGDKTAVETQLEDAVENTIKEGDKIIFAEEGEAPPILPDHKIFFYKDEDNDNIDDESGQVLDGIGLGLYDELKNKGITVDEFKFTGDNQEVLQKFKEAMESQTGATVSLGKPDDSIATVLQFTEDEAAEIAKQFGVGEAKARELYTKSKGIFEDKTKDLVDKYKELTVVNKEFFSEVELSKMHEAFKEYNKGDYQAAWKLMHRAANEHDFNQYLKIADDPTKVLERINAEKANLEGKLESIYGRDIALQVANLDAGKKVGLLGVVPPEFIQFGAPPAPGEIPIGLSPEEIKKRFEEYAATNVPPEEWAKRYGDHFTQQAYEHFHDEVKGEYGALKVGQDPSKWTPEQIKANFEERVNHESEAYLAGLIKPGEFGDAAKRAEVYNTIGKVENIFASKGVKDTNYFNPEDWKAVYEKYKTEGKLSDADVKQYEATATAYRTYDAAHQGEYHAPEAGNYDAKTGSFTYVDPTTGSAVSGTYKEGQYTYRDPSTGTTYTGTSGGAVYEHTATGYHYPEGYYPTPGYPTPSYPTPTYPTPTYTTPPPGYVTPAYSYPTPTGVYTYPTPSAYSTPTGGYTYPTPHSEYPTPTVYSTPTGGYTYPTPSYPTPHSEYPTPAYSYPTPSYGTPDSYSSPYGTPAYSYPTPYSGHFVLVDIPDYIRTVLERAGFVCEKDPTTQRFSCKYGTPG